MIQWLIDEIRVPSDLQDDFGKTILHCAIQENHVDAFNVISEKYPKLLDTKNFKGNRPIHVACEKEDNSEFLNILIKKGLNISSKNRNKEYPIHIACSSGNLKSVKLLAKSLGKKQK